MDLINELVTAWNSRYPLVWLISSDEARVESILKKFARKVTGDTDSFRLWSLSQRDEALPADPVELLNHMTRESTPAVYLIKDIPDMMAQNALLLRLCRDLYYALRTQKSLVVFLTPNQTMPDALRRECYLIPVDIPTPNEIHQYLEALFQRHPALKKWTEAIPQLVPAVRGLTFNEIFHLANRMAREQISSIEDLIDRVFSEKEQVIRKESALEFVPPRWRIDDIGGLDVLKSWLMKRTRLFTPEARKAGLPCPKGILIMGISGCGKSLAVKAISSLWKLPLFRLDMNLVFASSAGDPEWIFYRALKQVEAMAPAILWFDEIEMGVGRYHETGAEGRSHLFSTFLTWMQEREGDVFIAATANRIHLLPAELLRKGRFDQIFYVDLPENEERKEIFQIHLRRQGQDPSRFDLVALSAMTAGWTGAEIEQAVINARIEALNEDREMTMDDLITAIGQIVPLSKTMEDQIKAIKAWAYDRAIPASSHASRRYR